MYIIYCTISFYKLKRGEERERETERDRERDYKVITLGSPFYMKQLAFESKQTFLLTKG